MFKPIIKKVAFSVAALATSLAISTSAQAGPVDLSTWGANGGSSSWNVQGTNNDTVLQTVNGRPTVFFDSSAAASSTQGTALNGKIKVQTSGDDDFIGFVLGYNPGEIYSSSADYYLIDWKQQNQNPASIGLALSHVTNGSADINFWDHINGVTELQRGATLGNVGWADFVEYDFNIVFTSSLIEVTVNGVTEISFAGSFNDGAFGFYNYSQGQVLYSAIQQTNCQTNPGAPECQTSVPEAPALTLFGLGLLGLGLARRRNQMA